MAHTMDAIVYDPATGYLQMIVIPDDDKQLSDPAFNPPGMTQLRVPVLSAEAVPQGSPMDVTTKAISAAATKNVTVQLAPPPANAIGQGVV